MFGLDTIKLAIVGGLVLSMIAGGTAIYYKIRAGAVAEITLQQQKLVAAEEKAQYELDIAALQRARDDEKQRADDLSQVKEAIHVAAPISIRACLTTPAGRAWLRVMRQQRGSAGPSPAPSVKPLDVPARAANP